MKKVKPGRYQHYKGHICRILGVAHHSETLEELVVYSHNDEKYGNNSLWVRPKKMFLEDVEVNGQKVSRFKYLGK